MKAVVLYSLAALANTRPHQLHWGDHGQEMGMLLLCQSGDK